MSYIQKLRAKIQENTKKVNKTLKKEDSESEVEMENYEK
jgi:predicted Holliday junction resolvase-like endonuclease